MLRPTKIRFYVNVMQSRGFAAEQVLEGSGLDGQQLADPNCLVNLSQCKTVVANMIRLTGDQGIGLEMGRQVQVSDFGIIVHAIMSAKTLRQAVGYWIQNSNLSGTLIDIRVLDEAEGWTVTFSEIEPLGFIFNFCVEETLVIGTRLAAVLSAQPVDIVGMLLSFPAPLHAPLYQEVFGCPIQFNAPRCSITIRSPHFDTPLPSKDEELNEVLRRQCSRVMRQIAGSSPVSSRLRGLLLGHSGPMPKLEDTAQRLGMSARTLRRHLQQEGTSYQTVVDNFRFDLAAEYLASDDLAAKEIGFLLGFRDTNAFRRAFKAWSGQTIQDYRKRAMARA